MNILMVYAPGPREVHELALEMSPGDTAKDAIAQSGWASQFPALSDQPVFLSVWGRHVTEETVLREGDRLEICRGLRVDPKVARRERFVAQGARSTGLFSQRRPGSKAGY